MNTDNLQTEPLPDFLKELWKVGKRKKHVTVGFRTRAAMEKFKSQLRKHYPDEQRRAADELF